MSQFVTGAFVDSINEVVRQVEKQLYNLNLAAEIGANVIGNDNDIQIQTDTTTAKASTQRTRAFYMGSGKPCSQFVTKGVDLATASAYFNPRATIE